MMLIEKLIALYGLLSALANIFVMVLSLVKRSSFSLWPDAGILLHILFLVTNTFVLLGKGKWIKVLVVFYLLQLVLISGIIRLNFTFFHIYVGGPKVYVDILSLVIVMILWILWFRNFGKIRPDRIDST